MATPNPIFAAIDTADLDAAADLAKQLNGHVGGIKLGLEFFLAHGVAGYRHLANIGLPVFLDLKLHDIPNTVAGAVCSLVPLAPAFMTLHAAGGGAMMRAAADAAAKVEKRPKLLGVTVLTSLDDDDLKQTGQDADPAAQTLRLAKLAKDSGLDGVICSPQEVKKLRDELGPDFILMVPGIRPDGAAAGASRAAASAKADDQKRVLTPRQAMQAGATHLVIGRPITGAEHPAAAAMRIMDEIKS